MPPVTVSGSACASRKSWIDALRAIAVLFVIFGHTISDCPSYFVFTSPIKIPLFFTITGYLFSGHRKSTKDFFRSVLFGLVIPWIFLHMGPILLYSTIKGFDYLKIHLFEALIGISGWYMPCVILAEILHWIIMKVSSNRKCIILSSLTCMLLGLISDTDSLLSLFMLNRALTAQGFILLGYLINTYEEKLQNIKPWTVIIMILAYAGLGFVSIHFYPGQVMDVHQNIYYSYPICAAAIVLGNLSIFYLFRKKNTFPRVLVFIGQNTLVFYLWSYYTSKVAVFLLGLAGLETSVLLNFILTCLGCGLAALFLNRFLPFLAGKHRRHCATWSLS